MSILNTIKALAEARKEAEQASAKRKAMLDAFQNSDDYQAVSESAKLWNAQVERLENTLRAEALGQYANDNNKSGTGYKIKTVKRIEIPDPEKVKTWCLINFTPALKVDTKAVETAAKNGNIPADLVRVEDQPQVYIDSDLSQFLDA